MSASDPSSTHLEDFAGLDDKSLRQRWRRLVGRPMPEGLGRALAARVLAYQQQAQLLGDLDPASRRALADVLKRGNAAKSPDAVARSTKASAVEPKSAQIILLRPGTMLKREHGGVLHRVMVMEQGFSWNGWTYDSLSKVAFAITGTRWNGPRFFGLREKDPQLGRLKASRTVKQPDPDASSLVDVLPDATREAAL